MPMDWISNGVHPAMRRPVWHDDTGEGARALGGDSDGSIAQSLCGPDHRFPVPNVSAQTTGVSQPAAGVSAAFRSLISWPTDSACRCSDRKASDVADSPQIPDHLALLVPVELLDEPKTSLAHRSVRPRHHAMRPVEVLVIAGQELITRFGRFRQTGFIVPASADGGTPQPQINAHWPFPTSSLPSLAIRRSGRRRCPSCGPKGCRSSGLATPGGHCTLPRPRRRSPRPLSLSLVSFTAGTMASSGSWQPALDS